MLSVLRKVKSRIDQNAARAVLPDTLRKWQVDERDTALFQDGFVESLLQNANLAEDPQDAFLRSLGHSFIEVGQPELSIKYYRKAFNRKPNAELHGTLLQAILLSPDTTNQRMYDECCAVYERWLKPSLPPQKPLDRTPDQGKKRLKVGYVCHFFHNSVSRSIGVPFIAAHDRERVEIFCYSDAPTDDVPDDIRAVADCWRDTQKLDADAFEAQIRADKIDVLLEMNGHNTYSRYDVMARRLAPVQISFYNQASTCGIPAIDYTLVDGRIIPPEEDKYFTETIYRLPNAYGVAKFYDVFPEVSPSPATKNGYVTFCSLGSAHKVSEYTVDLWCRVLRAVPNSRFFMKAGALTWEPYAAVFIRYFEKRGIARERITFEGWSDHGEMLKRYANVDIALDTLPHNAGTTTLESLWMGLPVVSMTGNRLCGRTGMSMLTNLGHPEWIAKSPEQFVEIAASLARDPTKLARIRASQREKMRQSPLCNVPLFARDLEDAYHYMWKRWCEEKN